MELIADILLVAGALGAGLYCFVLSRRLKRFTDLEKGVGGAVAVLSAQADELKRSLDTARTASDQSGDTLEALTTRAESVAQRLELMMASMHDIMPEDEPEKPAEVSLTEPQDAPPDEAGQETADAEPETEDETEPTRATPEGPMFVRHRRATA